MCRYFKRPSQGDWLHSMPGKLVMTRHMVSDFPAVARLRSLFVQRQFLLINLSVYCLSQPKVSAASVPASERIYSYIDKILGISR